MPWELKFEAKEYGENDYDDHNDNGNR